MKKLFLSLLFLLLTTNSYADIIYPYGKNEQGLTRFAQSDDKVYAFNAVISGTTSSSVLCVKGVIPYYLPPTNGTTGNVLVAQTNGQCVFTPMIGGSGSSTPGGNPNEVQYNNAGAFGGLTPPASGLVLVSKTALPPEWETPNWKKGIIQFTFDGGGAEIATSKVAWVRVAQAQTINSWSVNACCTGNILVSISKSPYGLFDPRGTVPMSNSGSPVLVNRQQASDTVVSWTDTTLNDNDYIYAEVLSCSFATQAVVCLGTTKQ